VIRNGPQHFMAKKSNQVKWVKLDW